jgi:hypothetical protein
MPSGLRLLLCGLKFSKEIHEKCDSTNNENSDKIRNLFADKDRVFKDTGIPYQ